MDCATAGLTPRVDFALVGHPENWKAAADVFSALRGPERAPLPDDEIKDILPWLPPRAVCHVDVQSTAAAHAHGLYIDSFIPPDRLDSTCVLENLTRVRAAAAYAIKAGARIVSLGGFSSILTEGNLDRLPAGEHTAFTTGNTLTVAFIVQGIEKMCAIEGRDLRQSTLLVIGATGDVGSGCVRCLAPKVRRVVLHARNPERLRRLAAEIDADEGSGRLVRSCAASAALSRGLSGRDVRSPRVEVEISTSLDQLSNDIDIVICAASLPSPSLLLNGIARDALVCDAGYPKNLAPDGAAKSRTLHTVFFGGLGQITGGLRFDPDLHGILNRHPFPDVAHGCLLEGIALALEGRFEPFSRGRGGITPEHVEEIGTIAARHGIRLAPFFNGSGPLPLQ